MTHVEYRQAVKSLKDKIHTQEMIVLRVSVGVNQQDALCSTLRKELNESEIVLIQRRRELSQLRESMLNGVLTGPSWEPEKPEETKL